MRRRRLRGIVFATLAMCTLILVAAVVSRVGHASNEATAPLPAFPPAVPPTVTTSALAATAATPAAHPAAPAATEPTTGTLRIERPAVPGRVWLDGKKVTAASSAVSCGTHQVKIGARGHAHAVQIPCGGEFVISR